MSFRNADLELKLLSENPQLFELFENYAQTSLGEEARMRTEQRVRAALRRVLRGDSPTLAAVAQEMSMSTRTLQRKLSEEGLSFSGIVDALRKEIAEQYVSRGRTSMVEIAYMLGFADPQFFYRAFKRWTGTTPTNFRNPAPT